MSIKGDVYELTKGIKRLPEREGIRNLIKALNTSGEAEDRSALGYYARNERGQFLGYLLVDSHREKFSRSPFPTVMGLQGDERAQLETGHRLLVRTIDALLEHVPETYRQACNPYSRFLDELLPEGTMPQVDLSQIAISMQTHPAVEALRSVRPPQAMNDGGRALVNAAISFTQRIESFGPLAAPPELMSFRFLDHNTAEYTAAKMLIAIVSIRSTLERTNQLLFQAFCSDKLTVLGEDNVIDMSVTSTVIGDGWKVLCQLPEGPVSVGDLVLVEDREHQKQLCRVVGEHLSYSADSGMTAEYSLRSVDDNMNTYPTLLASFMS